MNTGENEMPHIIVKLYPGKSEQDKKDLTKKIVENVVSVTQCKETAVSVAIEEIQPDDWAETVYRPDIMDGPGILYKQPGYDPFSSKQEKATLRLFLPMAISPTPYLSSK